MSESNEARNELKSAYVKKALEMRKLQGDVKWNYAKQLTHKELQECDAQVTQLYLDFLREEAEKAEK